MADVVRARFADAEAGRAAVVELESRGVVDAERISIEGLPDAAAEGNRRALDEEAGMRTGKRAISGGIIGSVIGAALGLGVTLLLDVEPQPVAPLAAMVGFALFFGAAGFYYSVASRLAVTEGAAEAGARTSVQPVDLVIHLDGTADEALVRPHLEAHGAQRIETS